MSKHWAYSAGEAMVSLAFGLAAGIVKMTANLCVAGYKWSQNRKMAKKAANVVIGPSSLSASAATTVATTVANAPPIEHHQPAFQRGYGQGYAQRKYATAYQEPEPDQGIAGIVDYEELIHLQEQACSSQTEPDIVIDPYQPGMVESV